MLITDSSIDLTQEILQDYIVTHKTMMLQQCGINSIMPQTQKYLFTLEASYSGEVITRGGGRNNIEVIICNIALVACEPHFLITKISYIVICYIVYSDIIITLELLYMWSTLLKMAISLGSVLHVFPMQMTLYVVCTGVCVCVCSLKTQYDVGAPTLYSAI